MAIQAADGKARIYAVFFKDGAELTINLHRDENSDPEQNPYVPIQIDSETLNKPFGGNVMGATFFLMGVSGGVPPTTESQREESEPKFYFSSPPGLNSQARRALVNWFDAVFEGTTAYGRTESNESFAMERSAFLTGLQKFPFMSGTVIGTPATYGLELAYAKRTGPEVADVSLGLDLDFRVTLDLKPGGGAELAQASACVSWCSYWPKCSRHAGSPHVP